MTEFVDSVSTLCFSDLMCYNNNILVNKQTGTGESKSNSLILKFLKVYLVVVDLKSSELVFEYVVMFIFYLDI